MVRLTVGPWRIRVWRTEASLAAWNNSDLVEWATAKNAEAQEIASRPEPFLTSTVPTAAELMSEIERYKRIAAVEILTEQGSGFLLYPDWK
jgi:hypothetical protein